MLYLLLGLVLWPLCNVLLCLIIFFILRSILSDMSIATPAFFWFQFARNIFSHPLTFNLYMSLEVKWVYWRQHICASCFCIHLASLCLLVVAFSPFTFNYWCVHSYFHFINCFVCVFVGLFSPLLLLFFSLVIWWLSLVLCLDWFFLLVCVSIVDVWFAVILKFWYESKWYMYLIYMRLF